MIRVHEVLFQMRYTVSHVPPQLRRCLNLVRIVAATLLVASALLVARPPEPAHALDLGADIIEVQDASRTFMTGLLSEINARRAMVGTAPLALATHGANGALDDFLAFVGPSLMYPNPCMHLTIGDALAWDFVADRGYGGSPLGEVLACPTADADAYWTPALAADSWMASPSHAGILYADPDANAIACGAYATRRSGRAVAAAAVLCVTFRE